MKQEDVNSIYAKGPEALYDFIKSLMDHYDTQINELKNIISKQNDRIEDLEARLCKNSNNSNKPPSSDGLRKERKKRKEKSSGKKAGGQKGHKGSSLKKVKTPDHTEIHNVNECSGCNASLDDTEANAYRERQVFDIPSIKIEVTEHKAEIKVCPHCGIENEAIFPEDIRKAAQYGKRIKGLIVYLSQYQLIPYERIVELLNDIFEHPISKGTIYNFNKNGYEYLENFETAIKKQLVHSPVVHSDETGVNCNKKLNWLHVVSTSKLTYYLIHAKRGKEAMDEMDILPHYNGTVVHDFWKSYLKYSCHHAICNAHILRELEFVSEHYNQKWATEMQTLLLDIKNRVANRTTRLNQTTVEFFEKEYDIILKKGFIKNPWMNNGAGKRGRKKQTKARNLLERLKNYKKEILAFMYDFKIPFDNNQAERDLRMAKVQQKISGCFRSKEGGAFFARIRGCISTVRKNDVNVFDALQNLFAERKITLFEIYAE